MSKNPIKDYQRGLFIHVVYIVVLVCENEGKKKEVSLKEKKGPKIFSVQEYLLKNKIKKSK